MKIGVFDSGVGGLTVLKAISQQLPGHSLIYLGDTAHVPYGNKSRENILRYSRDNTNFLLEMGAEMIVIACNTASAVARRELEKSYQVPITGVVVPGVEAALHIHQDQSLNDKPHHICVAGTFRTVDSHIYREEILNRSPHSKVIEVACPSLVSIIEEGLDNDLIFSELLKHYLLAATQESDTLILGCTHYPLYKEKFKQIFPMINLVDSAEATADKVKQMVIEMEEDFDAVIKSEQNQPDETKRVRIFSNDINEVFLNIAWKLFPEVTIESKS